jgi:methylase of polypeptide subunit release factors
MTMKDMSPFLEPLGVCGVESDTRLLAEIASSVAARGRALDMGTGTGYVAIAMARAGLEVDATDVSPRALKTAEANVQSAGVKAHVYESYLFKSVKGPYDVIAFNSPMNPDENEMTRFLTSTLCRWNWLAGILTRLLQRFSMGSRDDFLVSFVLQSRDYLSQNGRLVMIMRDSEINTLVRTVVNVAVEKRFPVPSLVSLNVVVLMFRQDRN